jgi:hypothetical protein
VVSDLAAVLRDQEGYYLITFHPEKESPVPAVLQPRGKVLNLRWRAGYTADRSRMAPPPVRPAAGGDVRVHVTALFAGFSPAGYFVDAVAHVDARDLSAVRDLKGINHLSVDVEIAPYTARGKMLGSKPVSRSFDVDDAAFAKIRKVGIGFATRLGMPSAGAYQVRATVADGMSDRVGTAMEVVDLPPRGALAISGLLLKSPAMGDDDFPAMAVFHSGDAVALSYNVFNATAGPANESHLSVRTRIYAGGRPIHEGKPIDLQFPAGKGEVRQVSSKLVLDAAASEGEYAVEVEVTDLLAKQDSPRVATQYRTFQVAQ